MTATGLYAMCSSVILKHFSPSQRSMSSLDSSEKFHTNIKCSFESNLNSCYPFRKHIFAVEAPMLRRKACWHGGGWCLCLCCPLSFFFVGFGGEGALPACVGGPCFYIGDIGGVFVQNSK